MVYQFPAKGRSDKKIKPEPINVSAGKSYHVYVTTMGRGFLRRVATLHDRLGAGYDGVEFPVLSGHSASLAAWNHAARIVDCGSTFDSRGYSIV